MKALQEKERAYFQDFKNSYWKSHLKISTCSMYPWVKGIVKDENGVSRIDGAGSSIIETLSHVMNFTYEFYGGSDLEYGVFFEGNQSWTGVGGLLQQKVVDMQFAWSRVLERQIRITPSREFFFFSTKMLASVGDSEAANFIAFVSAFDVKIWYCVFTMIAITILVSAASDVLYRKKDRQKKNEWKKNVSYYFWLYLSALFSEGSIKAPYSHRSQTLLGLWLLTILTLSNGFTSQFKANLMKNKEEPRMKNMKDLSERPDLIPYLALDTIYHFAFKFTDLEERKEVYKNVLKREREAFINILDLTKIGLYQKVKSGKGVTFCDELATKSFLMETCDQLIGNRRLYLAEEDLSPFMGIFGLRDDVPPGWLKKFNNRIQWMVEAYIFLKLANDATWKYKKCEDKLENEDTGLEIKHLMPVFYLLGMMHSFCIFVFIGEIVWKKLLTSST